MSLTISTAWRMTAAHGDRVTGAYQVDAAASVAILAGRDLVKVEKGMSQAWGDVRFLFSDGHVIEVFGAVLIEPWVLRTPDWVFSDPDSGHGR